MRNRVNLESKGVPYEKKILHGLVGGVLLLTGFLLIIFWNIDEFWFIKLIVMFVCIILGLILLAVQFGGAPEGGRGPNDVE